MVGGSALNVRTIISVAESNATDAPSLKPNLTSMENLSIFSKSQIAQLETLLKLKIKKPQSLILLHFPTS